MLEPTPEGAAPPNGPSEPSGRPPSPHRHQSRQQHHPNQLQESRQSHEPLRKALSPIFKTVVVALVLAITMAIVFRKRLLLSMYGTKATGPENATSASYAPG